VKVEINMTARVSWTMLQLLLLVLTSRPAAAQAERHFVFVDCTQSMLARVSGGTRFDAVRELALAEVEVALLSEKEVWVIPFDWEALDRRTFTAVAQVRDVRSYLESWKPNPNSSRGSKTAIWATVESFLPVFRGDSRTATVSIFTDGEDNVSEHREAFVRGELSRLFPKNRGKAGNGVCVWMWKDDIAFPPAMAVQVLREAPIELKANELLPGPVVIRIPVRFVVQPDPGGNDMLTGVSAEAELVSAANERHALLLSATLDPGVVTGDRPDAEVVLSCRPEDGTTFDGTWEYDIDLTFDSRCSRPRVPEPHRERKISASRSVRLRITSEPSVDIVPSPTHLTLVRDKASEVTLMVSGNSDARGLPCTVRAVTAADLSLDFLDNAGKSLGASQTFLMPRDGSPTRVKVSVQATGARGGEASFVALVGSATRRASIDVSVLQPRCQAGLAYQNERTALEEGPTYGTWTQLNCGPLRARIEDYPGSPVRIQFTVEGDGASDIEVGLGNAHDSRHEVVADSQDRDQVVPLFARWRAASPPTGAPRVPRIRVEAFGADGNPIPVIPAPTIDLQSAISLRAPSIWITSPGGGESSDSQLLKLPRREVRAGASDELALLLNWNAGARNGRVTVRNVGNGPPPGVCTLGSDGASRGPLESWQYGIPADETTSTPLALALQAPTKTALIDQELSFEFENEAGATCRFAVKVAWDITPVIIGYELRALSSDPTKLMMGVPLEIATLRLTGGGTAGSIRLQFQDAFGTPSDKVSFAGSNGVKVFECPETGTKDFTISVEPKQDLDLLKEDRIELLLKGVPYGFAEATVMRDSTTGGITEDIKQAFGFEVEALSLAWFRLDDKADSVEGVRFRDVRTPASTADLEPAYVLRLIGASSRSDLGPLAETQVRVEAIGEGLLFESCFFRVKGETQPRTTVELQQLLESSEARVEGLEFWPAKHLEQRWVFPNHQNGRVRITAAEIPSVDLESSVGFDLEPRWSMGQILLVVIPALAIAGMAWPIILRAWLRKRRAASAVAPPPPGDDDFGGAEAAVGVHPPAPHPGEPGEAEIGRAGLRGAEAARAEGAPGATAGAAPGNRDSPDASKPAPLDFGG
jgi:hypothetical protein